MPEQLQNKYKNIDKMIGYSTKIMKNNGKCKKTVEKILIRC